MTTVWTLAVFYLEDREMVVTVHETKEQADACLRENYGPPDSNSRYGYSDLLVDISEHEVIV